MKFITGGTQPGVDLRVYVVDAINPSRERLL
jgi:hypothetical protein